MHRFRPRGNVVLDESRVRGSSRDSARTAEAAVHASVYLQAPSRGFTRARATRRSVTRVAKREGTLVLDAPVSSSRDFVLDESRVRGSSRGFTRALRDANPRRIEATRTRVPVPPPHSRRTRAPPRTAGTLRP